MKDTLNLVLVLKQIDFRSPANYLLLKLFTLVTQIL